MSHRIHENSRAAYNELRNTLNDREMAVYDVYLQRGAMPDRKVKNVLGYDDMNAVRPRITYLIKKCLVVELLYKVKDEKTGISVRVCRAASVQEFMTMRANNRQMHLAFV